MKQFITILTLLLALQLPSMAQEEELGTEGGPTPSDLPVDGGLTFLLAAGAAYGGRRLTQKEARKAD
jgi:hypothetical protein